MYIALEAGIGLGALFSGWYYQDVIARIPLLLYISAGIVMTGMLYMLWRERQAAV
jgi:predicted MFS family arabinose efflux permease